jgi:hypothetical protein
MLPILGGVFLFLLLPLLIVIAMMAGSLAALGGDGQCVPIAGGEVGKSFGYPTKEHGIEQGWDNGNPKHTGLDYKVAAGTAVLAAADGRVVSVDGDWIKIQHDEGVQTWYEFLQSKKVHVGDKVKRGDEIGKSGSGDEGKPGISGDHLHFELRALMNGGNQFDPIDPTDQVGDAAPDPNSGGCGCGNGSGGPLVGTNNQQKAFNFFASNGYSKEQAAGIVGNMIHESGVEPARKQGTPPGSVTHPSAVVGYSGGWGIVQWTPAGKMITPSKQQGADDNKIESLAFQLSFLKQQLDGEGPVPEGNAGQQVKKAKTVQDAAVAFGRYYERFLGSDNLSNARYSQRKTAAQEVLQTFGGGAGGSAGGAGGCAGAGNGDIVATARSLAWDTQGHGIDKGAAKPEYQNAMPKYNGATAIYPYTDCGVFVATVMVMSGVDKDYVRRLTTNQRDYVRGSSKYQVLENVNSVSELQPGDIFVNNSHTFIYTGNYKGGDGRTYNAVSASLNGPLGNGHVPQASNAYFVLNGDHYSVARIKK